MHFDKIVYMYVLKNNIGVSYWNTETMNLKLLYIILYLKAIRRNQSFRVIKSVFNFMINKDFYFEPSGMEHNRKKL